MTKEQALMRVSEEMSRQAALFGEQNHLDTLEPVKYFESAARHAKQRYEECFARKTLTWEVIMFEELYEALELSHPSTPKMKEQMIEELLQVASVACSWALAVARREP